MQKADLIRQSELKFAALNPVFDERVRRQWAAAEAMAYGWGGVTAVSCATGLSIDTIRKGIAELSLRDPDRSRYAGRSAAARVRAVDDGGLTSKIQNWCGHGSVAAQETGVQPARQSQDEGWVVEHSFAWAARFRRLARNCERLADTLVGLHFVTFVFLMLIRPL